MSSDDGESSSYGSDVSDRDDEIESSRSGSFVVDDDSDEDSWAKNNRRGGKKLTGLKGNGKATTKGKKDSAGSTKLVSNRCVFFLFAPLKTFCCDRILFFGQVRLVAVS